MAIRHPARVPSQLIHPGGPSRLARARRLSAALSLSVLLHGGAAAETVPPPVSATADAFASAYQEALGHWAARTDPKRAEAAITSLERALAVRPDDTAALILLARACYYHGHLLELGTTQARLLRHRRGYEAAARASELDPRSAAAEFWAATNLAVYGKLDGVLKSVSSYTEIRERLARVDSLEPGYFYGGVARFNGRLIDQVPSSLRALHGYDLDDAVAEYQKAAAREPRYLQTWVYLGECYLQAERWDDARAALQRAADGDPAALPDVAPENLLFRSQARRLLDTAFPETSP